MRPTCYAHGYSNHQETFAVMEPDALLAGSPQADVTRVEARTAIGRRISDTTVQGNSVIERSTYFQDPLGHTVSMTRYGDPVNLGTPVVSNWPYDSLGLVLQSQVEIDVCAKQHI